MGALGEGIAVLAATGSPDVPPRKGFTFFGCRGPWYTAGYLMAVAIEKQFGRAALVETLKDPRQFVARYNAAAGGKHPLFSREVLDAVNGQSRNP